jgi:hypothetical protein
LIQQYQAPARRAADEGEGARMADQLGTAALVRFQNLVLLCKQLRLRVAYKVHEIAGSHSDGSVDLTVVVHVLNDSAFKKYLNNCSLSDLLLFRGLLVKVSAGGGQTPCPAAGVLRTGTRQARPAGRPAAGRPPAAAGSCLAVPPALPSSAATMTAAAEGAAAGRGRQGAAVHPLRLRRCAAGVPAKV